MHTLRNTSRVACEATTQQSLKSKHKKLIEFGILRNRRTTRRNNNNSNGHEWASNAAGTAKSARFKAERTSENEAKGELRN